MVTDAKPRPVKPEDGIPEGYITGLGRDCPALAKAHLYKGDFDNPGLPMCRYGWNRDGGESYSIWRGNVGFKGVCKICMRRAHAGLNGVESPVPASEPIEPLTETEKQELFEETGIDIRENDDGQTQDAET